PRKWSLLPFLTIKLAPRYSTIVHYRLPFTTIFKLVLGPGSLKNNLMRKHYFYITILPISFLLFSCDKMQMELNHEACTAAPIQPHPKSAKLDQIEALGVPGVVMALKDHNGTWAAAAG